MSATKIAFFISFFTLGISSQQYVVSTAATSNNETDTYESEESPSFESEEIQERYRRLIPYMTYYVVNNYVAPQHQVALVGQSYTGAEPENSFVRRPVLQQINHRPIPSKSRQRTHKPPDNRFVPSVQYNPKELPQDANYFMPLNYRTKERYHNINPHKSRPPHVSQIPAVSSIRYDTTSRPVSFVLPEEKEPITKIQQQDYAYGDDREEFESVRFATPPEVKHRQGPVRYLQPIPPRPVADPPQPVPRISLNHILKSLELTNQLPESLNKDNIDSSIKTLVEILNILNVQKKENYLPVYEKFGPTYAKPKVITESSYEATQLSAAPRKEFVEIKPANHYTNQIRIQKPIVRDELIDEEPIIPYNHKIKEEPTITLQAKNKVQNVPNKIVQYYVPIVQDIDEDKVVTNSGTEHSVLQNSEQSNDSYEISENNDQILENEGYSLPETTTEQEKTLTTNIQNIPPSLKYGATRGKPHVDYPAYTEIPETDFSCKQQRYKGFFGDPATGCQVWHYCDLNGGKSSFLCPNGTIFSQVALTCDWWFNVKCESTTQLYVLNERLYKYILPIMPKFPEDFTGPEVDKYLELKFKEMEQKLKEKQMKKEQEEKGKSTINTLQSIEDSK